MPTYSYECEEPFCRHEWEQEQNIKDPAVTQCPKCQCESAKRVIAPCSFTLKGSRWASTGYK